jgi:predicted O-methyltransferase YrrM
MDCGRPELVETMKLFHHLGGETIVEIGSIRNEEGLWTEGHSTLLFAQHAKKVWSVDIDPRATALTRRLTESFGTVEAINMDGLQFLAHFNESIDLLYLDGWDTTLPECAVAHLAAYRLAKRNLHERSIIVIDDANPKALNQETEVDSKARLVLPEAEQDGWRVGLLYYQMVLVKPGVVGNFLVSYPGSGE